MQQMEIAKRINTPLVMTYALQEQRWLWAGLGGGAIVITGIVYFLLRLRRSNRMLEELNTRVQRSQNKLQATLDAMPDLMFELGLDGRYLEVHPPRSDLPVAPVDSLVGKTVSDVMSAESANICLSALREAHEKGYSTGNQLELALPHGKFWFELSIARKKVAAGDEPRFIGISRDITESKRLERKLEESQRLLRQLAARNESAREDERKRLKREIHDELGQYLLALRLGISVLGIQLKGENPNLEEKTQRLIEMVDATIKVVRNVVASLRPAALDMGIASALEWLVGESSAQTGIQCELHVAEGDIPMDEDRATAIFRIAQESLTNIARHAKASRVSMTLERQGDAFVLEVRDNGVGFDTTLRKDKSFGLVSIQERALMLGGEVDISSTVGHGTSIRVHIPIHNAASNALSKS